MLLEDHLNGFEKELRRQIHHREIFIVERANGIGLFDLAFRKVLSKLFMRLDVALEIHADESRDLQKSRIDPSQRPGAAQRHVTDQVALEPVHRMTGGKFVDLGRLHTRIDRASHQGKTRRTCGVLVLTHDRRSGERRHAGLADRHQMCLWPEHLQKRNQMLREVVETKCPLAQRHIARAMPIGDVDIMIQQQGLNRAAQQGGEVPGHRRDK